MAFDAGSIKGSINLDTASFEAGVGRVTSAAQAGGGQVDAAFAKAAGSLSTTLSPALQRVAAMAGSALASVAPAVDRLTAGAGLASAAVTHIAAAAAPAAAAATAAFERSRAAVAGVATAAGAAADGVAKLGTVAADESAKVSAAFAAAAEPLARSMAPALEQVGRVAGPAFDRVRAGATTAGNAAAAAARQVERVATAAGPGLSSVAGQVAGVAGSLLGSLVPALGSVAAGAATAVAAMAKLGVEGTIGVATAAVGGLYEAVERAGGTFHEMGLAAERAGVGVEWLSRLSAVAGTAGVDLQALSNGFRLLEERAAQAAEGDKSGVDAFARLGMSVKDAAALMDDPQKMFERVRESLAGIANSSQRAQAAQQLLGRGGNQLIPLLTMDTGQFDRVADRMQRLGGTVSEQDAAMGRSLGELEGYFRSAMLGVERAAAVPVLAYLERHMAEVEPRIEGIAGRLAGEVGGVLGEVEGAFDRVAPILAGVGDGAAAAGPKMDRLSLALAAAANVGKLAEASLSSLAGLVGGGLVAAFTALDPRLAGVDGQLAKIAAGALDAVKKIEQLARAASDAAGWTDPGDRAGHPYRNQMPGESTAQYLANRESGASTPTAAPTIPARPARAGPPSPVKLPDPLVAGTAEAVAIAKAQAEQAAAAGQLRAANAQVQAMREHSSDRFGEMVAGALSAYPGIQQDGAAAYRKLVADRQRSAENDAEAAAARVARANAALDAARAVPAARTLYEVSAATAPRSPDADRARAAYEDALRRRADPAGYVPAPAFVPPAIVPPGAVLGPPRPDAPPAAGSGPMWAAAAAAGVAPVVVGSGAAVAPAATAVAMPTPAPAALPTPAAPAVPPPVRTAAQVDADYHRIEAANAAATKAAKQAAKPPKPAKGGRARAVPASPVPALPPAATTPTPAAVAPPPAVSAGAIAAPPVAAPSPAAAAAPAAFGPSPALSALLDGLAGLGSTSRDAARDVAAFGQAARSVGQDLTNGINGFLSGLTALHGRRAEYPSDESEPTRGGASGGRTGTGGPVTVTLNNTHVDFDIRTTADAIAAKLVPKLRAVDREARQRLESAATGRLAAASMGGDILTSGGPFRVRWVSDVRTSGSGSNARQIDVNPSSKGFTTGGRGNVLGKVGARERAETNRPANYAGRIKASPTPGANDLYASGYVRPQWAESAVRSHPAGRDAVPSRPPTHHQEGTHYGRRHRPDPRLSGCRPRRPRHGGGVARDRLLPGPLQPVQRRGGQAEAAGHLRDELEEVRPGVPRRRPVHSRPAA